ncbi:MAG: Fe-S cluster assembly sulfur transfer protein SufU [Bacteroidota bacterium]
MDKRLKSLYQSVILEHNKSPLNFEKKEAASYQLKAYNSMCGDKYQLYFDVVEDRITNVYFHGYGCAISKAATSILTKHLDQKTFEEAQQICHLYLKHLQTDVLSEEEMIEEFEAFSAAQHFPGRAQCASLSWVETLGFLEERLKSES